MKLCNAIDVPEGEIRKAELEDGRVLAVYNVDGKFFATDDLCTHGEASLSEGEIEDEQIICPFHLGAFDIKTGKPTAAPCTVPLRTYDVEEIDGVIKLKS